MRYLSRFDDGEVVRWAFRGMLIGAIGVLALDLRDLSRENGWWAPEAAAPALPSDPILPPAVETDAPMPSGDPRRFVTADEAILGRPMTFTLRSGGVLSAEGSIEPGTAARFAAEIEARGEYVKTVSLNSPGGALDDAMAMAQADARARASRRKSPTARFAPRPARCSSPAARRGRPAKRRRSACISSMPRRATADRAGAGDVGRAGDDGQDFAPSDRHGRRSGAVAACARYAAAGALLFLAGGTRGIPAGHQRRSPAAQAGTIRK